MRFRPIALSAFFSLPAAALFVSLLVSFGYSTSTAQETGQKIQVVNVYSYRQPFLVEPLFAQFTAETGIQVKVIFAKKGLIERVKTEGKRSPADVILTVDIGRLHAAREVAQPVRSAILTRHIPARARGRDDTWFGLTWRARVAYV